MAKQPVAIILLHLNGFDVTNECLRSLAGARELADIIVVCNGTTDGSDTLLLKAHPYIHLITSPMNLGFAAGNNLGMRWALEQAYPYILLLNNDTLATTGFERQLLDYLNAHPDVGAVQPKIYFQHNRSLLWNAGSFYNRLTGFTTTRGLNRPDEPAYNETCPVDWITGCAIMVRASVLRKTGLFAPNMFLYYEDVDLSFRIRTAGFGLVYLPAAVIYHIAGASGKQQHKEGHILPMVHYYNLRNRIWFLKKYTPWYAWPVMLVANSLYIGGMLVYFVARWRLQKLRAVLKAIRDGIRGSIRYEPYRVTSSSAYSKAVTS